MTSVLFSQVGLHPMLLIGCWSIINLIDLSLCPIVLEGNIIELTTILFLVFRIISYIILLLSFQMLLKGKFVNSIGVHIAFTFSWHGCV